MTVAAATPIELVQGVYATLDEHLGIGRRRLGRPLTLAEKILSNHLNAPCVSYTSADVDDPLRIYDVAHRIQ